jgi:hypothetical protein
MFRFFTRLFLLLAFDFLSSALEKHAAAASLLSPLDCMQNEAIVLQLSSYHARKFTIFPPPSRIYFIEPSTKALEKHFVNLSFVSFRRAHGCNITFDSIWLRLHSDGRYHETIILNCKVLAQSSLHSISQCEAKARLFIASDISIKASLIGVNHVREKKTFQLQ